MKILTINHVARPELMGAWANALAERITPSAENSSNAQDVVVEFELSDGALITYRMVHKSEGTVALRSEPALNYVLSTEQAIALLGDSHTSTH